MPTEWYYAKDGQQYGPVSSRELKQLADQGMLLATDVVWKDGMPDWRPAGEVQGLIPRTEPPLEIPPIENATGYRGPTRRRSRSVFGPCVLIVAALALIAAMFVPWWSMRLRPGVDDESKGVWAKDFAGMMEWRERELEAAIRNIENSPAPSDEAKQNERRRAIALFKAVKRSRKWWDAHLQRGDTRFTRRFRKLAERVDDDRQLSLTITQWGWNEGYGITSLVFGAVVLLFATVFVAVPPLRNWSWIVSAVALAMGIVALILSLIWIFKSPGQDVTGVLSQGVVVGPWLMLGGGIVYFVTGLFDTIFGILFVVRK